MDASSRNVDAGVESLAEAADFSATTMKEGS